MAAAGSAEGWPLPGEGEGVPRRSGRSRRPASDPAGLDRALDDSIREESEMPALVGSDGEPDDDVPANPLVVRTSVPSPVPRR